MVSAGGGENVGESATRGDDSSSDSSWEEDEDTGWEERGWRALVAKVSFSANRPYNRTKMPYSKYAPQIPFFMHLVPPAGASRRRLRLFIPQTVVLGLGLDPGSGGLQQTWLMNDGQGYVQRRDEFDVDRDIVAAFGSDGGDPSEVVAIFKRKRSGSGGEGDGGTQTMLLNTDELRDVVYNRQSYGMFALQKFVRLRKGRAFIARSVWQKEAGGGGHKFFAYFITNNKSYAQTADVQDLLVDLTAFKSATVNVLRGVAVEDLEALTDQVAQYVQRALGVEVEQLVVDFTKGNSGRWCAMMMMMMMMMMMLWMMMGMGMHARG
jgi:hypothetical protein